MTHILRRTAALFLLAVSLLPGSPAQAQAVPPTPTPAVESPTLPLTGTELLIGTESLTATENPTETAAPTGTAALTETAVLTGSAALTGTAPLTASPPLTAAPAPTGTLPATGTLPGTVPAPLATDTPALTATLPATLPFATEALLDQHVEALLAGMSPADRVGQLFILDFTGSDTSFESAIAELIYAYRIGGVVISPEEGNFSNEPGVDTPRQVAVLANQLQAIAYGILLPTDVALQPVPNQPWPPGNLVSLERELGVAPPNLPLLVGVQQMGDNLPGTALRRGFTPLPSPLAIGSTWSPPTAQAIGAIVGRELRAVGVNLLMGPSLDVIDQPRADAVGSLGIFSFGGNGNWVGRMGRAYIAGVHTGSQGRVATVASHFPGQGDIDRLPTEDVATIQRSLADLERIALPPFLAVTQAQADPATTGEAAPASPSNAGVTDILLTSQMRFNALQTATGRATPISQDPELSRLIDERLGSWRGRGGLLMTGALGVPAIRRFYDPTLQEFPARRVALDAFIAGHDLLYLSSFSIDDSWTGQLENYRRTIAFFQERYRSDPDFATRVDDSVRRTLRLKLRLYLSDSLAALPEWSGGGPLVPLSQVLVQEADLAVLPAAGAPLDPAVSQAARESLTILYPDPADGALPPAPQAGENIVIVTDSRLQRECATCTTEAAVDPDTIARTILALYGPDATGQIAPANLRSYTFSDLIQLLPSEPTPAATPAAAGTPQADATATAAALPTLIPLEPPDALEGDNGPAEVAATDIPTDVVPIPTMEEALEAADWIIFAMLDVTSQHPNSDALRRFLRLRGDTLDNQRIVVWNLNAPYFLDATEIGTLTLYYGVYSKTSPFLETAVRALFRSLTPAGAPAVNAPGTHFASLEARLAPDAARRLPLQITAAGPANRATTEGNAADSATATPVQRTVLASNEPEAPLPVDAGVEPLGPAIVGVGETVRLSAGPVLDRNGHPVPDGVPVLFEANFDGAELALTIEPTLTRGGMAVRDVVLERGGVLRVLARAGDATSGQPVLLSVLELRPTPTAEVALVSVETPASAVLPPSVPITAPNPVTLAEALTTAGGGPAAALPGAATIAATRVNAMTLLLSLLTMLLSLSLLLLAQIRVLPRETLFKSLLWAVVGGLVGYLLYGMGWLPGSRTLAATLNVFGAPLVVFFFMLLPLFWLQLRAGAGQ